MPRTLTTTLAPTTLELPANTLETEVGRGSCPRGGSPDFFGATRGGGGRSPVCPAPIREVGLRVQSGRRPGRCAGPGASLFLGSTSSRSA